MTGGWPDEWMAWWTDGRTDGRLDAWSKQKCKKCPQASAPVQSSAPTPKQAKINWFLWLVEAPGQWYIPTTPKSGTGPNLEIEWLWKWFQMMKSFSQTTGCVWINWHGLEIIPSWVHGFKFPYQIDCLKWSYLNILILLMLLVGPNCNTIMFSWHNIYSNQKRDIIYWAKWGMMSIWLWLWLWWRCRRWWWWWWWWWRWWWRR